MRSDDDKSFALECLKLAAALDPSRPIEQAREFYGFVTGDAPPVEWHDAYRREVTAAQG
jgi:hypothetical protein